eukprot:Gregarina_sp_Poly_1__10953@NODE_861_length_5941_cov_137_911474_g623_i0_p5_GENE_NODE_861_length_5941_cov_137_911474_g623_i0NODE_861_length_5941_cov_137_911474_g623_i0_p5_ORF_typecomplete_len159_score26_35Hydrolase_4/PF12146_8/9_9e11Abhydrolase_6/PF12697_7/3_7e07DLH/PF01738_18/5_2e07BAAT_C/PF08840_11/1_8e05Peptidase_S15/PF02129_18/2e05Acyl_transf_2/PF02273_15/7e05Abhydrolase_1/PF00561_20/9_5e05DUF1749/PF08538_10/0_00021DUF818/PF05677_12/0_0029DUF1100/PF06500_11/0_0029Abhydrolase_5/PF12695_7/0_028D
MFEASSEKAFIPNLHKQKLACSTRVPDPKSKDWIILCHGVFSWRKSRLFETIMAHCPFNTLAFDFYRSGDSEGDPTEWSLGDYEREAEIDLRGVVLYLQEQGLNIKGLIGHSRGANVVLMYAHKFDDVPFIVSLAARFDSATGLSSYFAPGDQDKLER